ncbi:diguanylate cyclase [Arsenicicoccus dermatophilus]|uniref:GGDEF domain-containing protein n=1 Tax=Arsenicicoccus dermatophilus TaxID=1076331 RepID=UPI003916D74A
MSERTDRQPPAELVERAWQLRNRDGDTAALLAAEALRREPGLTGPVAVVRASLAFGEQNFEHALATANSALPSPGGGAWPARLHLVLANVFAELGEPLRATGLFAQAIRGADEAGDEQLVAQCLLDAALDEDDAEVQLRTFHRALRIFERLGDDEGIAYARIDVAHALADRQDLVEAAEQARLAGTAADRAGSTVVLAHARVLEAHACAQLGLRLQAMALTGEVARLVQHDARPGLEIDVTVETARVWQALGDADHMVALLEPLTPRADLADRQRIAITDLLAEAYAWRGDLGSAYWMLRAHVALRDDHEDALARRRAGALLVLHRVQQAEQEAADALERARRITEQLADLSAEHRAAKESSIRDELTGLHNRRLLDERLRTDVASATPDRPVSLLLLDLDRFKDVNDTHGHVTGDQVLREVGRILLTQVRSTDVAARYGGEELAVLQPGTDLDAACALAERLRAHIREADWQAVLGTSARITVSVGAATSLGGESALDLLRRADDALYAAKSAGRDQVRQAVPAG